MTANVKYKIVVEHEKVKRFYFGLWLIKLIAKITFAKYTVSLKFVEVED